VNDCHARSAAVSVGPGQAHLAFEDQAGTDVIVFLWEGAIIRLVGAILLEQ
jgi:hypothetical protein